MSISTNANTGVSFGDIVKYIESINSGIAAGVAEFLEKIGNGLLSEAQKLEALGDYYTEQFSDYASKAREWATKADSTGNSGAARTWDAIATQFDKVAQERAVLGTQAWTEGLLKGFAGDVAKYGGPVGDVIDVGQMAAATANGDYSRLGEVSAGLFYGTLAGVLGGALAIGLGLTLWPAAILIGFAAYFGTELGEWVWKRLGPTLQDSVSDLYTRAQGWFRRDPLTLDLDADGIETVGINPDAPILFDHDGDGVKNGTGWIAPDDGFLVLDRNGNGTIDNGTELFGDSTPLSSGGKAVDGFAALRDQDTNSDGVVDSNDANFANLRVWRDLNQDGISQSNELFTLSSLNIASLNVAATQHSQTLANGNQIADLGTYTKTDGSEGTLGEVSQMGDVNLVDDTFHREFPDQIQVTPEAELLPNMQGSGLVRDLREAVSQNAALASALTSYAAATTRSEQMSQLEGLLTAWAKSANGASLHRGPRLGPIADTSGMVQTLDDRNGKERSPQSRRARPLTTSCLSRHWYIHVRHREKNLSLVSKMRSPQRRPLACSRRSRHSYVPVQHKGREEEQGHTVGRLTLAA